MQKHSRHFHASRRSCSQVVAFLLVCLFSVLAHGCSAGRVAGYGGVALLSAPDAQGHFKPNYANLSGDLNNPTRLRWVKSLVLYRVRGGNFLTHPAAVRGMGLWNVALKQLPPEAHAPTLREAQGDEAEDISLIFKPFGGDHDGTVAGSTSLTFAAPGSPVITHAEIVLDSTTAYLTESTALGVSAHEGGHSLGICSNSQGAHSPDSGDVMDSSASVSRLSNRDVNTVAEIYRGEAGSAIQE